MVDEAEAFDKEPLRLFVINNSEAISLIENQPSYVEKYKNIVNRYKNCKIAVVLLGIKDESLGYSETDIYRNLRDSKSMIIFNNIGEVKFVDMPYGIQRVFDKDISIDEGYYMRQSNISKYKYLVT